MYADLDQLVIALAALGVYPTLSPEARAIRLRALAGNIFEAYHSPDQLPVSVAMAYIARNRCAEVAAPQMALAA